MTESKATRMVGWLLISPIILWSAMTVYINIHKLLFHEFTAFVCARMANDFCGTTLNLLVVLLWHTFTSKSPGIHKFWRWRTWFLPTGFMPGGFAPRPAAFSVGLLLFVTGALVQERVVTGKVMMSSMDWHQGMQCRANSVDVRHPTETWFGRFNRGLPNGCFLGGEDPDSSIVPHMFTREDLKTVNASLNDSWVVHPRVGRTVTPDRIPIISGVLKALHITWFDHNNQNDDFYRSSATENQLDCMYLCVWWENWGVHMIFDHVGVILSGAFVVVSVTDSLSAFVGFKMVTEDTGPEELGRLFEKMVLPDRWFRRNSGICAIQIIILRGIMAWWAPKFDRDGYFTVDYYVSTVFTISMLTAVTLRIWNPYLLSPVVYTKTLWTQGEDMFVCVDHASGKRRKKKVDLYEWIHMSVEERVQLLILYARRVSSNPAEFEDALNSAKGPPGIAVVNLTDFTVEKSHEDEVLLPVKGCLVPRRIIWKRRVTVAEGARGHALKLENGTVTVRWSHDPRFITEHDLEDEDARLFRQENRADAYDMEVDPLTLAEESTKDDNWDALESSWLGEGKGPKAGPAKLPLPR